MGMDTSGSASGGMGGVVGSNGPLASSQGGTDTGSSDTDSTESTESESGESGSSEGATSSEPASPRFKFKRFGRDAEHTAEEMRAMLDDDYEHDFHGVGGKPLLVEGKPVKMRAKDIARAVQLHTGALESMRKANAETERVKGLFGWAKQSDENFQAMIEQELGVEDYDSWLYERSKALLSRDKKMVELMQTDPDAYQNELRKQERARFERQQKAKETQDSAQRQKAEQQQKHQQWWGTTENAFKGSGVPFNDRTRAIAEGVAKEYAAARADLTFDELAAITRDLYHDEIFGYLDGLDDEKLLGTLGDKRRERLRQADLAALKGKKAAAKQTAAPATSTTTPPRSEPKGMTAAEFLGRGKNNGRI